MVRRADSRSASLYEGRANEFLPQLFQEADVRSLTGRHLAGGADLHARLVKSRGASIVARLGA